MKDLQVGDRVLTLSGKYAPVYAFGHYNHEKRAEFVQLTTRISTLELTPDHLVFLNGKKHPVRADSVHKGDMLRGQSVGLKVLDVNWVERAGVYTPLTSDGTILVDGIAASSYISLQAHANEYVEVDGFFAVLGLSQHLHIHMGLSPLRLLCMGVSSSFCDNAHDNEEGMPSYVNFALRLQKFIHSESGLLQLLALLFISAVTGSCLVAESLFGPIYAPTTLLLLGLMYWLARCCRIHVRITIKWS